MKIEDQVCTIEQAKKLKELGVVQESYLYHFKGLGNDDTWRITSKIFLPLAREEKEFNNHIYSAFTVAELGVAIGSGYYTYNGQNGLEWVCYNKHDVFIINGERFPTEAQARAALLIHLIEKGTLKVDEVNKRLEA